MSIAIFSSQSAGLEAYLRKRISAVASSTGTASSAALSGIASRGAICQTAADTAVSLSLNDLDTKRSQRLDELLWRFGVGDQAMDLVGGADTRNTPPAKLAGICHHGDFLGYPH